MHVYERLGVPTLMNAAGPKTRLGGARMAPEVLQAMREANEAHVDIAALQAAASRIIAEITRSEAGYVTSGAAAGLTLSAAACMTGTDPAAIGRLPHAAGLRDEIVIFRPHRNSYDHAWSAAGARLVEVGFNDRGVGSGLRSLERWELAAAIGERTAAVAYVAYGHGEPPLAEVVEVAHARGVPVIVDAAAQLPPEENLWRFSEAGADLVAFSGGKAIGGPQGTGILCGRRDLIQAVALNHLDMDVAAHLWEPPAELIPPAVLERGLPHHGIGRGFKVSKEDIAGVIVALQRFASGEWRQEIAAKEQIVQELLKGLDAADVRLTPLPGPGFPRVAIDFGDPHLAQKVYVGLLKGEPAIALDDGDANAGILRVDTMNLSVGQGEQIASAIRTILARGCIPPGFKAGSPEGAYRRSSSRT